MKCKKKISASCSRERRAKTDKFQSWDAMLKHYQNHYLKLARQEKEWFSDAKNLVDGINKAVKSELNSDGNYMASHQRRIGRKRLYRAKKYFVTAKNDYQQAKTFAEIMDISDSIRTPSELRIGKLARYDFSSRIAAYLGVPIKDIYLHAGTLIGAKNLGFCSNNKISKIEITKRFPKLKNLSAEDIENFLCIYKDSLPPPE